MPIVYLTSSLLKDVLTSSLLQLNIDPLGPDSLYGVRYESSFFFSRWLHSLPFIGHLLKSSLLDSVFSSSGLSIHAPVAGLFKSVDVKPCKG